MAFPIVLPSLPTRAFLHLSSATLFFILSPQIIGENTNFVACHVLLFYNGAFIARQRRLYCKLTEPSLSRNEGSVSLQWGVNEKMAMGKTYSPKGFIIE